MAYYSVRHVTRFHYSDPIRESVMELRMQPRDDGLQRLHSFELAIQPRGRRLSGQIHSIHNRRCIGLRLSQRET